MMSMIAVAQVELRQVFLQHPWHSLRFVPGCESNPRSCFFHDRVDFENRDFKSFSRFLMKCRSNSVPFSLFPSAEIVCPVGYLEWEHQGTRVKTKYSFALSTFLNASSSSIWHTHMNSFDLYNFMRNRFLKAFYRWGNRYTNLPLIFLRQRQAFLPPSRPSLLPSF